MGIKDYKYLASKYFVDDIESALLPCTPLSITLKALEVKDKMLSDFLV
jgi:hypothetical protein